MQSDKYYVAKVFADELTNAIALLAEIGDSTEHVNRMYKSKNFFSDNIAYDMSRLGRCFRKLTGVFNRLLLSSDWLTYQLKLDEDVANATSIDAYFQTLCNGFEAALQNTDHTPTGNKRVAHAYLTSLPKLEWPRTASSITFVQDK